MNLFEEILLNIILIIFPILVYLICSSYQFLRKEKYNNVMFFLILFSSIYLLLNFGSGINNNKILLFCNIPIILAYLKRKEKIALFLSIFTLIYCNYVFDYSIIFMSIKFLVYYIFYIAVQTYRVEDNDFIAIIASIQGFFVAFEYFFTHNIKEASMLFELFGMTLLFYIITFILLYLSNIADKITTLFYEVKNIEKEKEINNALFKLTHEIKNPLAVCKGYLDMLDINDSNKLNRYVPIIKQEINRSLNIASDFLDYSKIKINKDIVDINVLLDDVYDSFKILNNSRNIKFIYNEKDIEVYVNGDYDRLKQVLLNLLKNSSEAIEDRGKIILDSKVVDNKCIITVEDNGIGMTKETLSQIKKLFYTTKKEGSGIGVSLSNEIIKAHDGKLDFYSTYQKGSRVEIELPCHMFSD